MPIEKVQVKIKKLHGDAKIPHYGSDHAASFDIYSLETYELQPGEIKLYSTGK